MNTEQLDAFLRVAREGSISKAARGLFVSQSAITQQLASLERTLGFKLFVRSPRGVSLTEQGRAFLPYANTAIDSLQLGIERCRSMSTGEVRVAADYEAMFLFVAQATLPLARTRPDVKVVYREYTLRDVLGALTAGEADVCFFAQSEAVRAIPNARFAPLFRGRTTCFVADGHPLCNRKCVKLSELVPFPVVIAPRDLDDCFALLRDRLAVEYPDVRPADCLDNPFVQGLAAEDRATVFIGPHWRYQAFSHRRYHEIPLDWPQVTQEGLVYLEGASERVLAYIDAARNSFLPGGHLAHMDAGITQ